LKTNTHSQNANQQEINACLFDLKKRFVFYFLVSLLTKKSNDPVSNFFTTMYKSLKTENNVVFFFFLENLMKLGFFLLQVKKGETSNSYISLFANQRM
jgi:hypothetical protein